MGNELIEIKLEYDHPLCNGTLDDNSDPFEKLTEESYNIFKKQSIKFLLPTNAMLKSIGLNNISFGTFLDSPEKLQEPDVESIWSNLGITKMEIVYGDKRA